MQPQLDLDSMDERIKIRDAIQNGRIQDAISMVNSLHPELLDNNRYLYFHLQVSPILQLNYNIQICNTLEETIFASLCMS